MLQKSCTRWQVINKAAVFAVLLILITYPSSAKIYPNAEVVVNNQQVEWGASPVNINGEILVPLKEVSEVLGIRSSFDINQLTAVIKMDENEVGLKLDSSIAVINGKYIQLPAPFKIVENRIMVPVRLFENLGMYITVRDNKTLLFKPENGKIIYKVVSGDYLWKIGQTFQTSYTTIKTLNGLTSNDIYIGQMLVVRLTEPFQTQFDAVTGNATIESGPDFWHRDVGYLVSGTHVKVTGKNGLWYKVSTYKGDGYIYYTVLNIIQTINDATPTSTYFHNNIPVDTSGDSVLYTNYTVVSGDTLWAISEKKGIPVEELMSVNGLTWSTYLRIGQVLKIPVHTIGVKPTPGSGFGEMLDWFSQGQYVFPISKEGRLIDLETGLSFNVRRTMGASHADTETVTANDTQIMKQVFGGTWTWVRRPFILEVEGRSFAVSVSGMPHAGVDGKPFLQNVYNRSGGYGYGQNLDRISGNQMDGHFDLYFLNGLRHKDNQIDPDHQKSVLTAGGLQ